MLKLQNQIIGLNQYGLRLEISQHHIMCVIDDMSNPNLPSRLKELNDETPICAINMKLEDVLDNFNELYLTPYNLKTLEQKGLEAFEFLQLGT